MKHTIIVNMPPSATPSQVLPDGAVIGNGDLSLVWSGTPERLRLYVCKSDFWKADPGDRGTGGICPIGYIEFLYLCFHIRRIRLSSAWTKVRSSENFQPQESTQK